MNWLDAAPFWERLLFGVLGGAITWWSAADIGRSIARLWHNARPLSVWVSCAAGYAAVGSAIALLALAHLLSGWSIAVLFAAQFARRWYADRRFPIRVASDPWAALRSPSPVDMLATVATAAAWLTGLVAAALPATWWDPIAYHLPIVAFALAQHTFALQPMVQSAFPLLGEAAALPAFALGGSAGAAVATLGAGIVLALLCGEWAERLAAGSGRLAVALVSCSALWLWLAPSFYVDVPFALFVVAALYAGATGATGEGAFADSWLLAGALAGAAAATKYTGLAAVGLTFVVAVACATRDARLRAACGVVAGALAVAGGWYVRTVLLTHDPVYPFLSAHAAGATGAFAQRYATMTLGWCGGGTTPMDALALPLRIMTQPRSYCGDPGYALDLGAVFVLASLLLIRRTGIVLACCAALTAFWFFSSQQLRFLVPAVCLFAIAAAAGTSVIPERTRVLAKGVILALCVAGVVVNWLPGPARDASNSVAPGFAYVSGAQSGDDYLSQRLEFYDAVRWIRAQPASQAQGAPCRIAALNDVRDYYFGPDVRWFNPYYQPEALDWRVPNWLLRLSSDGDCYAVVNANPAYVGRTPTGIDWHALAEGVNLGLLRPRFSANGVTVYALVRGRSP